MRVVVAVAVVLVACGHPAAPRAVPAAGPIASNVLRADYAGSSTCGDCHAAIYESWAASPMRNMTRDAATAKIRAPFDGAVLRVGADTCTMTMIDGKRGMIIRDRTGTHRIVIPHGNFYRIVDTLPGERESVLVTRSAQKRGR